MNRQLRDPSQSEFADTSELRLSERQPVMIWLMKGALADKHRNRRTTAEIVGAREAAAIAATLGGLVDTARMAKRLTQADLGRRVGLSQPRISDMLRGRGAGAPLSGWIALGIAV